MKKTVLYIAFLWTYGVIAQSPEQFRAAIKNWQDANFPIKIGVILNQPFYAPGDTAFYSVLVLNPQLTTISTTHIVTVRLQDAFGRIVLTQQVLARKGVATNAIALPNSLLAGAYELIVYNDWMLNFNKQLICRQPLLISTGKTPSAVPSYSLQARAEGGYLVADVDNRIHIASKPLITGSLKHGNQAIQQFTTNEHGLATITIKPKINETYSAEVDGNEVSLGKADTDALTCLVINPEDATKLMRVALSVAESSSIRNNAVQLLLICQGELFYQSEVSFKNRNQLLITIPKKDMPIGISVLYAVQGNQVLVERLIFNNQIETSTSLDINQHWATTRQAVNATLTIQDKTGNPIDARVSIRVFKKNLFSTNSVTPLSKQLLIDSDLINKPHWLKGLPTGNTWNDFDAFLATQPWSRYRPYILDKPKKFDMRQDIRLSTRILDAETGKPVPDSTLVSFYLTKHNLLSEGLTRKNGLFEGSLPQFFYGTDETFFRAEYNGKLIPKIQVDWQADTITFSQTHLTLSDGAPSNYYGHNMIKRQVESSYSSYVPSKPPLPQPHVDIQKIPSPDAIIDFDDYLLFPTMSEAILEFIPLLSHKLVKEKNVVRVYMEDLKRTADESPIFIMDGVMTDNIEYFLNLKPSQVDKVKIINKFEKLDDFGRIGKNGLVLVETKIPGNQNNVPRSRVHIQWIGLAEEPFFYSTSTISQNKRVPQLTPALYWKPDVLVTGGKYTFQIPTSDDVGVYTIVIEGINALGEPVHIEQEFSVRNNLQN